MGMFNKIKHRRPFGAGLAALAATAAAPDEALAALRPKASGETKIVAVFGTTTSYNGIGRELDIRTIFNTKDRWRIICVRAASQFTPALIADADLLLVDRGPDSDAVDLSAPDAALADSITPGAAFWTAANVRAIMDNVQNRGMGLMALNTTVQCGNFEFTKFLDIAALEPHHPEPIWYTRMSKSHPIMSGVGKFASLVDEQPLVVIKSSSTVTLFESTAVHEKRQGVSGWALERGKGRIVGLLPGSTDYAFKPPEYRNIFWRAAHWAMNQNIPTYPEAENLYY